ncbi:MAG: FHA domain-containing protein [Pseudomonadota bacterium]
MANAVMTSLSAFSADWLLIDASGEPSIALVGAIPAETPFAPLEALDAFAPRPVSPAGLQGAFEMLADRDVGAGGRKALFAPGRLFPANAEIQAAVAAAAKDEGISLFPITDDAGLGAMALLTGGAPLAAVGEIDLADALAPLFGGGTVVIDLPEHRQYRLPNEPAAPLTLVVSQGGEVAEIELMHPAATLSSSQLATRFVDPRHWGGWIATPGRRVLGIGAMGLTALILLGLGLVAGRQITRRLKPRFGDVPKAIAPKPVIAGPWTIGRREDHAIRLADASVSRDHARLEALEPGSWQVTDLGSANGTFVEEGGVWLRTQQAKLAADERVRLGGAVHTVAELLALARGEFVSVTQTVSNDLDGNLSQFKAPRRNPITGEIEEGA